jgi:hypothetical protein
MLVSWRLSVLRRSLCTHASRPPISQSIPAAEAIPAETLAPVSPLSQLNALDTLVALTPLRRGNLAALGLPSWLFLVDDPLVRILNLSLQFEITEDEIELGIRKWVVDYEWSARPFRVQKYEGPTQSMRPASTTSTSLNEFHRAHNKRTPPHS